MRFRSLHASLLHPALQIRQNHIAERSKTVRKFFLRPRGPLSLNARTNGKHGNQKPAEAIASVATSVALIRTTGHAVMFSRIALSAPGTPLAAVRLTDKRVSGPA